jgi:hypothetical protein
MQRRNGAENRIALFGAASLVAATGVACSAIIGLADVPEPADASAAAPGDAPGENEASTAPQDAPLGEAAMGGDGSPPSVDDGATPTTDAAGAPAESGVPESSSADSSSPEDALPDAPALAPDSGSPVSLQGCVLLLHMDEPNWSGAGAVRDASGLANNGTARGDATTTPAGKFGGAALFGGTGYVDILDSASLHPSGALTYAAWIYPTGFTSDSQYPGIIAKRQDYGVDVAFTMFLWTGNALWGDLEASRFNSQATIANGRWYHVAIVFDGTQPNAAARASIYVDGVLDSVHPAGSSLASHTADVTIGFLPQGSRNDPLAYFVGRIDEVAIWNRALGADEIRSLSSAAGPL